MKQNYLISIIGATAIGKTALSIKLAKYFEAEIISCDSRQFYKEMSIGTAVPSSKELQEVKHHFIQNRSIFEDYNVGAFEQDTITLLDSMFQQRSIVIMVGGSGLYVDAVLKGLDDFPEVDPQIRTKLATDLEQNGILSLQNKLSELDPLSYKRIDINNKQRLIRALEICIGTNHPFSFYLNAAKKKRNFKAIKIGIKAEREIVYSRINQRVDQMMKSGLLEEAKKLFPNKNLNALQTVGYRELFSHFDGDLSIDQAISEIKKNSRRFAKRQGTWFRRDNEIIWFDYQSDIQKVIDHIEIELNR